MVHHTIYELRHLYGDLLYQVFRRWDRLCDPFQKYVLPSSLIGLYLLSHQHLAFLVNKLFLINLNSYLLYIEWFHLHVLRRYR